MWPFVDGVNANNFLRRYAGHLENGKIGKSDPAIGLAYDRLKRVLYRYGGVESSERLQVCGALVGPRTARQGVKCLSPREIAISCGAVTSNQESHATAYSTPPIDFRQMVGTHRVSSASFCLFFRDLAIGSNVSKRRSFSGCSPLLPALHCWRCCSVSRVSPVSGAGAICGFPSAFWGMVIAFVGAGTLCHDALSGARCCRGSTTFRPISPIRPNCLRQGNGQSV